MFHVTIVAEGDLIFPPEEEEEGLPPYVGRKSLGMKKEVGPIRSKLQQDIDMQDMQNCRCFDVVNCNCQTSS